MKKSYYSILVLFAFSTTIFAQVDYTNEIQSIFNSRCTSCHGSNGGLNLSSYEALFNSTGNSYGTNIVVPNDADASGLVDKIEPEPEFGSRMPQGGMLDQTDIDKIRLWINEGANAVPTSNEIEGVNPTDFKLIGNFPNPFNPTTQIHFEVPLATQYTISVYSLLGELVAEQVGNVSAGRAQVPVNLTNNPSGVYFYKVSAKFNGVSKLIGSGRMTLVK